MQENIYDIIRMNIKKYRLSKKMTQAELAEKIDLSYDFVRQIESPKVASGFSVETLYKISIALEVEPGLLFKKEK